MAWLSRLREDIQVVLDCDPAARTRLEVVLCYSGLHAIWTHRLAHWMWNHHARLLSRILSQLSRWLTGIEIHPGAKLGRRLFIETLAAAKAAGIRHVDASIGASNAPALAYYSTVGFKPYRNSGDTIAHRLDL